MRSSQDRFRSILCAALVASVAGSATLACNARQVLPDSSVRRTRIDSVAAGLGPPTSVYRLPELTVVATRHPVAAAEAPTMIRQLDIENDARLRGGESLGEVLASNGFAVRPYGSTGVATLSLRGASASQTAVVLDGFRLTNAQLGQLDLSLLPTALIDNVEVMSGSASALYGSDAVGGVVHATTRSIAVQPTTITAGSGAFGERFASGAAGYAGSQFAVGGGVSFQQTDGDFPYVNHALLGSPEVRRENADRQTFSALTVAGYQSNAFDVDATLFAANVERGLPGQAFAAPTGERQSDSILRGSGRVTFYAGPLAMSAGSLIDFTRLRYRNDLLGLDQTGAVATYAGRVSANTHAGAIADVTLIAEGNVGSAEHPALIADASRINGALGASAVLERADVILYPAVRVDAYDASGNRSTLVANPKLGLNIRPLAAIPVHLKADAGRSFRMPTFNDLFWRDAGSSGNPDLLPERSWSSEVGAGWFGESRSAEVSAFARRTRDQIVWEQDDSGIWSPRNVGRVAARGFQIRTTATGSIAAARLSADLNYTFVHARDVSSPDEADRLRYTPAHVGAGNLSLEYGLLNAGVGIHGSGRRFVTTDGRESRPAYLVADAHVGASITISDVRSQLRLVLENALDTRYEVISGYPMPPRHIRFQLTTTIG